MCNIDAFQELPISKRHKVSVGYEVDIVESKYCSSLFARSKRKGVDTSPATIKLNIHEIYSANRIGL